MKTELNSGEHQYNEQYMWRPAGVVPKLVSGQSAMNATPVNQLSSCTTNSPGTVSNATASTPSLFSLWTTRQRCSVMRSLALSQGR